MELGTCLIVKLYLRPIPLMTSSKMNKAPYFLHTECMALKYPFGAGTTPVVAPTTGSATTEKDKDKTINVTATRAAHIRLQYRGPTR